MSETPDGEWEPWKAVGCTGDGEAIFTRYRWNGAALSHDREEVRIAPSLAVEAPALRAELEAARAERDHFNELYAAMLHDDGEAMREHHAGITESYQRGYEEQIEAATEARAECAALREKVAALEGVESAAQTIRDLIEAAEIERDRATVAWLRARADALENGEPA